MRLIARGRRRNDEAVAAAAHDVTNLLGIAASHAELLLRDAEEAGVRDRLGEILAATRSAVAVAATLLPPAAPEPGTAEPVAGMPALADGQALPAAVAERAASLFSGLLDPGVRLTVARSGNRLVAARAVELEQVLVNLLLNARDAVGATGGRIELAVADTDLDRASAAALRLRRPGPYVTLTVADSGSGIPPEAFGRIFEPGFTTKRPGTGTGLGLSAVAATVERLGGSIAVESATGVGTNVTVFLPAVADAALVPEASQLAAAHG